MTEQEAKQLIPEKSFVEFAGAKYRVAEISGMAGGTTFIGIYDEPPTEHVDYLNAENVQFIS